MFKTASEVLQYIKDNDIKFVDVRFTDLPGVQQHFSKPVEWNWSLMVLQGIPFPS